MTKEIAIREPDHAREYVGDMPRTWTSEEFRVAEVRMRLFAAANVKEIATLEAITGLGQGVLIHALAWVDPEDRVQTIFYLWKEWGHATQMAREYQNFALYVRNHYVRKEDR